jgi:hypothetical protein
MTVILPLLVFIALTIVCLCIMKQVTSDKLSLFQKIQIQKNTTNIKTILKDNQNRKYL